MAETVGRAGRPADPAQPYDCVASPRHSIALTLALHHLPHNIYTTLTTLTTATSNTHEYRDTPGRILAMLLYSSLAAAVALAGQAAADTWCVMTMRWDEEEEQYEDGRVEQD